MYDCVIVLKKSSRFILNYSTLGGSDTNIKEKRERINKKIYSLFE